MTAGARVRHGGDGHGVPALTRDCSTYSASSMYDILSFLIGGLVVRALDLPLGGREFDFRPPQLISF